jgi:hypothetical protein
MEKLYVALRDLQPRIEMDEACACAPRSRSTGCSTWPGGTVGQGDVGRPAPEHRGAARAAAAGCAEPEPSGPAGGPDHILHRIDVVRLLHLALYGFWIIANLGWIPGVPRWDETFVVLAMVASVEAIFLSTFVLISQNRMMAAAADQRADLDLQIGLLTEHEVTSLVRMVRQIAERVGVDVPEEEVAELERNVAPEAVLDAIEGPRPTTARKAWGAGSHRS